MKIRNLLLVVVVGLGLAFAGCKSEKDEVKKDEKKTEEKKADEAKAVEPKAEEPKAEEPKAEEPKAEEPKAEEPKAEEVKAEANGPKETAEAFIAAIKDKKFGTLSSFMPARYLADTDKLVRAFGEAMDKEVWDKAVSVTDRIMKVAKEKKEALIQFAVTMGAPLPSEDLGKIIDGLVTTWDMLKTLGLTDLENIKTFDTAKFAAESYGKIADQIWSMVEQTSAKAMIEPQMAVLETAKVELVSMEGEKAELSITVGGETEKVTLVLVDGKWLPEDMVKEWDKGIEEGLKGIGEMKEELAKAKTEILAGIAQVEEVVGQVEKTGDLTAALAAIASMGGGDRVMEEAPEATPEEGTEGGEATAEEAPAEQPAEAPAEQPAEAPAEEPAPAE